MTAEQFVYWLQGFMEINDPETISKTETQIIKDHLKLVFDKETPDRQPREQELVDRWKEASKRILQREADNPQVTPAPDWTWRPPYTITCTGTDTNSTSTGKLIC